MKTSFREYILGKIRSAGMTVDEVCVLCDITKPTLYRRLSEPDRIIVLTILILS